MVKVAILMADYGHDPTETAIPFQAFEKAGFAVDFITESGKSPECDSKMLNGWTQKMLGADSSAIEAYNKMLESKSWKNALSWDTSNFSLKTYDLVFLPGGHDKAVRQILDSPKAQQLLVEYFPLIKKPSTHACAAICHGVQALAHAKDASGKSVLHDVTTTALPGVFESTAYHGTRLFLGDYYKTYGAGTDNVEDIVRKAMNNPDKQWKSDANPASPFVVEDEKYNYMSGRWPGDAQVLADKVIAMMKT